MIQPRPIPAALAAAALAALLAAAPAALAQVRAPVAQPSAQPGVRAPDADPNSAAHAQLALRIDAAEQAARRQVVVLEQASAEAGESWPSGSDSWPNNNTRSEQACQAALGDRYGRVISRQRQHAGDRYWLNRVVCETQ